MKKELREPIKDPSIFDNEYFKVVYSENKIIYVKCDQMTLCNDYFWAQTLLVEGVTISLDHEKTTQIQSYTVLPKKSCIHLYTDDLDTDIQFISKEEFDEVKQQAIDMLS